MSLTARITLVGSLDQPEDFLSDSLGVIFPDDITNMHGDAEHSLLYTSPHLPKPLEIQVADPIETDDRLLFSHYLWNASLLLAEIIEAGTVDGAHLSPELGTVLSPGALTEQDFDIRSKATLELGAGTGLPSMLSALLGASEVVVVDYPTPVVIDTLRKNIAFNCQPAFSPAATVAASVRVDGHAWGELETPFAVENKGKFDRILVCDCLWMPYQHANLHRSIAHFMKDGPESRAWVVAGFHSGRHKMAPFFADEALKAVGLEVEHILERDAEGIERAWVSDRGIEDPGIRKRWLTIAVLKRIV
jgi:nicotinamide N-methyltransferase